MVPGALMSSSSAVMSSHAPVITSSRTVRRSPAPNMVSPELLRSPRSGVMSPGVSRSSRWSAASPVMTPPPQAILETGPAPYHPAPFQPHGNAFHAQTFHSARPVWEGLVVSFVLCCTCTSWYHYQWSSSLWSVGKCCVLKAVIDMESDSNRPVPYLPSEVRLWRELDSCFLWHEIHSSCVLLDMYTWP